MVVCHCKAVNDRAIRGAIDAGARDREELAARCSGAGARCGGCVPALESLLDELLGPQRDLPALCDASTAA